MSRVIEVEVASGDPTKPARDLYAGSAGAAAAALAKLPIDALGSAISEVVTMVSDSLRPSADGPESCMVKFGLKVSGTGNVILAKMGSELNLEVTITWKR